MNASILHVFGGIGLFLMGMTVLTDGLRALTGTAQRQMLARFTDTPLKGAIAGAVTTALVQSSSATTVTTVGFVGTGLLTFPQGLGIIFGANIGSTITGWMVAILGFKLALGTAVLPLIFAGVLLRLFNKSRLGQAGMAAAGFGVLFVGLDMMQSGMAAYQGLISPDSFPSDSLWGRLQMVALGALITMITHSSGAGVATALVALGAGSISFAQAGALVIGMDIGTTFTAVLATIGGATATRRTGYAHLVYNLMTGIMAFFLLGPYMTLTSPWTAGNIGNAQIALVSFHTMFNTLGVVLILPFTKPFARLLIWMIPDRGPPLARRLDPRLLSDPDAAIDATAATLREITATLLKILTDLLDPDFRPRDMSARLFAVTEALADTAGFMAQVRPDPARLDSVSRHAACLHATDHLRRLAHRCTQTARIDRLPEDPRLRRLACILRFGALALSAAENPATEVARTSRIHQLLQTQNEVYRDRLILAAARQSVPASGVLDGLDSARWLQRAAYHLWRIAHNLDRSDDTTTAAARAPVTP